MNVICCLCFRNIFDKQCDFGKDTIKILSKQPELQLFCHTGRSKFEHKRSFVKARKFRATTNHWKGKLHSNYSFQLSSQLVSENIYDLIFLAMKSD